MRRWAVTVTLRLSTVGDAPEQAARSAVERGLPGAEVLSVQAEPALAEGDYVLYERNGRPEYARLEHGPNGLRVRFGDGLIRPYNVRAVYLDASDGRLGRR